MRIPLSVIREINELTDNWRELTEDLLQGLTDIYTSTWRIICDNEIDKVQQEELAGDEYILGCFNAGFLADILAIDIAVIEAMQSVEAYEAIGKLIISLDKLEILQQEYSSMDGYGHHFAYYDFIDHEITIENTIFHFFKTN